MSVPKQRSDSCFESPIAKYSTTQSAKDSLIAQFHNRNKDGSKVLGQLVPPQAQHHQGLYKASMNRGTSQVNWDEVTGNKAKIAEYKERMLGQKQELGHVNVPRASSVKAHSYIPYGDISGGYLRQTANAKDNKEKDQRVQVTLDQRSPAVLGETNTTENRQNYKRYSDRAANDAQDMVNQLKSSNVTLSYTKKAET